MNREEIQAIYNAVAEACDRAGLVDMFGNQVSTIIPPAAFSNVTPTKAPRIKMGSNRNDRTYSGDRPRALPYRRKRGY